MRISDAVIVITGASSGIGRATALMAAQQGACLVLASRHQEALAEVASECERLGVRAITVQTDVTDEAQVRHLAHTAQTTFGRIDAWVNAAAVTMLATFEQAPPDIFRRVIETNLFGYVNGARAALACFRKQRHGVLVNIASELGKIGAPYATAYVASKFAITGFSQALRMELRDQPGIHLCTIFPATIDTPLFQHAANFTGRALQAPPPVYHPETVAAAILASIERPKPEILIGSARRLRHLRRLAPPIAERTFARKIEKDHFRNRTAPASQGNVFNPMPGLHCVHGGWANRQHSPKTWRPLLIVSALGIIALSLLRKRTHYRPTTATLNTLRQLARRYPATNGHTHAPFPKYTHA